MEEGDADRSPPVINTSINNWSDVSHLTGSPNSIKASIFGILGAGSTDCRIVLQKCDSSHLERGNIYTV